MCREKPVLNDEGFLVDPCTGEVVSDNAIAAAPNTTISDSGDRVYESRVSVRARTHDWGYGTYSSDRRIDYMIRSVRKGTAKREELETLKAINRLCGVLYIPDRVCETAVMIAKKYLSVSRIAWFSCRGVACRSRMGRFIVFALAFIYLASKIHGAAISVRIASEQVGVDRRSVFRAVKYIHRSGVLESLPKPSRIYSSSAGFGEIDQEVDAVATELLERFRRETGSSPYNAYRAGAVYLAQILVGREKYTYRQLAKLYGYHEVTIRNKMKEIARALGIQIYLCKTCGTHTTRSECPNKQKGPEKTHEMIRVA